MVGSSRDVYAPMGGSPGKRLALFRASLNLSQRAFAAAMGFSQGRIGSVEADIDPPSRAFLQRIGDKFGVSADWLLNGHGEMLSDRHSLSGFSERKIEPPDYARPGHGDFVADGEDYVLIERADLSVSAGTGVIPVEGAERERLAFSASWLRREGINPKLALLVRIDGDSMYPTLSHGALSLLHLAENRLDREGIFAFMRGDEVFVKRLIPAGRLPSGQPSAILIVSDNRAYPTETISAASDRDAIRIIGRFRTVMITL